MRHRFWWTCSICGTSADCISRDNSGGPAFLGDFLYRRRRATVYQKAIYSAINPEELCSSKQQQVVFKELASHISSRGVVRFRQVQLTVGYVSKKRSYLDFGE